MTATAYRRILALATATFALLALALPARAGAAPATPSPAPDRVAAYLAAHPGGQRLNDNEISYGELIVTLTAPIGTLATPDCPQGWYCFYERPGYGYPRGKLSSCGRQYLGTWGWQFRTESVHYKLDTGRVWFLYGSTRLFSIAAGSRTIDDVAPYRNMANYVDRIC